MPSNNVAHDCLCGVAQVLTSANWGGVVGNFFTGGLNLQVRMRTLGLVAS